MQADISLPLAGPEDSDPFVHQGLLSHPPTASESNYALIDAGLYLTTVEDLSRPGRSIGSQASGLAAMPERLPTPAASGCAVMFELGLPVPVTSHMRTSLEQPDRV